MACWDGPTSSPADKETRDARVAAHAALDPLWRIGGKGRTKRRTALYKTLSMMLGLPMKETHIGMFTAEQCAAVVEFCKPLAPRTTGGG